MCQRSKQLLASGDVNLAAHYAVEAWGRGMMNGTTCCTLVHPPFCLGTNLSASTMAVAILLGWLFLLFWGSCAASVFLRRPKQEVQASDPDEDALPFGAAAVAAPSGAAASAAFAQTLQDRWLREHSLRVLPDAPLFAVSASSLFSALREAFNFQADSVQNQYDHLLSLWRSHCSNVADREVQGCEVGQVDETSLLFDALGELHTELLEGFTLWREKMCTARAATAMCEAEHDSPPMLAGARWQHLPSAACGGEAAARTATRQLAEIATYLLIWGEAGNVRFMPEVLYFITELALVADAPPFEGSLFSQADRVGAPFRSNLFLSKIIRPIYNIVFDEWYERVEVDQKTGKDLKKLRAGYAAYLPPDVANYDDWNELFCDPERLVEGVLLEDGTKLFDKLPCHRFAALRAVDWAVTLDCFETKTHREVHSLWGVFATTHRVWLVHAILFFVGICTVSGDPPNTAVGEVQVAGATAPVRFAAVGLLVPVHAFLLGFARYHTTGRTMCRRLTGFRCVLVNFGRLLLWSAPLATYAVVRYLEARRIPSAAGITFGDIVLGCALAAHFLVSTLGLVSHLGFSDRPQDALFPITEVPLYLRAIRYFFWFMVLSVKFLLCLSLTDAVYKQCQDLSIVMVGHEAMTEIQMSWYSTSWGTDVMVWMMVWFTTFFLFCADTQMWFTLGCTLLGVATVFVQRRCEVFAFASEDAVSMIPERFSKKVLRFATSSAGLMQPSRDSGRNHGVHEVAQFASDFPSVWDRIIEYMRYEDKIGNQAMGDQSFLAGDGSRSTSWQKLALPVRRSQRGIITGVPGGAGGTPSDHGRETLPEQRTIKVPELFRKKSIFEIGFKHYCPVPDQDWPDNPEIQWRFTALSRGLGLEMPRPYRVPYIPGFTVLIPHFGESILMLKDELYSSKEDRNVPLIDWVKTRYEDEFHAFTQKMMANGAAEEWHAFGSQWSRYSDKQWDKICVWASMRMQTLWRTVAGMCLYHPALQCHYEVQGDRRSRLGQPGIWDPSDCFTCLVSMQNYKFFNPIQLAHADQMFQKFPSCLKVAFIDCEDKNINAEPDSMHPRQRRRYFSCLIDAGCQSLGDGRKAPRYRIELPGFPILGDGKSDNQNHAIPFMRGTLCQCIDSNQGAYFEQMLMLPCVLGEFRTKYRGQGSAKRIVGLPEHITSDIGSIGDFAAGSEVAFGTILQRSYSVLGARMHYGHPDFMNKQFMMQQGGVSKATKTLNLSEDIFAGMDFILRGGERTIRHCEYFHLAKGRDLGFNTVMAFFSKLSSGAGEQILTRQMFRLGQLLSLPECLTFYYAHVGYYITQALVSWAIPMMVFTWAVVLASDCEHGFQAFESYCPRVPAAEVMANTLSIWYSWVLLLFLMATSMPLFAEIWMERSFKTALVRFVKQYMTCSFMLFVFQAKIIGFYVVNELRYGGASYVSTGRGLPTERRPFIAETAPNSYRVTKVGGLYLDYAMHTYYDGMLLLGGTILILTLGGISDIQEQNAGLLFAWISTGLTIASWLFAPFIFNPYQFTEHYVKEDVRAWVGFFFEDSGKHWVEWYDKMQLQPRRGFRSSVIDMNFFLGFFGLSVWFAVVNHKISLLSRIYSGYPYSHLFQMLTSLPPLGLSLVYCIAVSFLEAGFGCTRASEPSHLASRRKTRAVRLEFGDEASDSSEEASTSSTSSDDETTVPPHRAVMDTVVVRRDATDSDEAGAQRCFPKAIPLGVSSAAVIVLQIVEALLPLYVMHGTGWKKTFVAGLVLKLLLFGVVLFLAEGVLRSRCFHKTGSFLQPLNLWVHANRMSRDIFTSAFIFICLVPFVALNTINESLCAGCSVHQLLIYRDPGHLARKEAVIIDICGDDEEEGDLEESEPLAPPSAHSAGSASLQAVASPGVSRAFGTAMVMPPVPQSFPLATIRLGSQLLG
ncbi:unnamed protein product [Polarella glacialis]|uniref:1,3-beta-glucan synthase n=1 Tax=Polarella glacialis TaxID=89957 RepID=A0A813FKL5_POLGL|nr:unnamed protein product [Polarella glacialis]